MGKSKGAQNLIGDFAPKLVQLTDEVLFDDIWERKELSKRDRNGMKKEELIEAITHLAFYAGWPNAMSAIMIAKELFSKS
jgi:4-carboxymuconolactone decarboxylase